MSADHETFPSRFRVLLTVPISGRRARDLRNDGGQDQEEQGVRRNLKIEIEQAVNEQCEYAAPRSQSRSGHNSTYVAGRAQNVARYQENKPQGNKGADYTGVSHDLQVIVMRLADLQRPVMRAVDRVGGLVRANPHAKRPPVADHRRSVAPYPATASKERLPAASVHAFRRQLAFLNAPDHGIGADPPYPGADRKDHHDYRAGSRSGEGNGEWGFPFPHSPLPTPYSPLPTPLKSECDDEHQPGDETDHPSARQ